MGPRTCVRVHLCWCAVVCAHGGSVPRWASQLPVQQGAGPAHQQVKDDSRSSIESMLSGHQRGVPALRTCAVTPLSPVGSPWGLNTTYLFVEVDFLFLQQNLLFAELGQTGLCVEEISQVSAHDLD